MRTDAIYVKKNNHKEKDCFFRDKKQDVSNKVALLTSSMVNKSS